MIATPVPIATATAQATPASLADVLSTRGAVDRVYLTADDAVWTVSSSGEATRIFDVPSETELLAIDPAPSAEQVAILLRSESTVRQDAEILVLDSAGQEVRRLRELGRATATPGPAVNAAFEALDWSPQGDRALVSTKAGTIVDLPLIGQTEPALLTANDEGDAVRRPAWSPTGERIAFLASLEAGRQALHVLNVRDGSVSEIVSPPEGRIVVDFAWMPDGVSLLFTEGGQPGAAATGIDLWRVGVNGNQRELIASAGTVAPVARIMNARPSPDGRSVAYVVLVPGPAGPQIDSLWVRDLDSRLGFRVGLPRVASVEDLWWTNQGLVIWVTTGSAGQTRADTQALLRIQPDGSLAVLWAAPLPESTPIGSPRAGTPVTR